MLLDEINLASSETLEAIVTILKSPTGSITLTEQGSLLPVDRHPDFRLFACMNPATDVGKKDLPPHIRSRFTEFFVLSPDANREALLAIVRQYIGEIALGDPAAILDIAEFYVAAKALAERREIADGSNQRPHYSMRTLTRALTFTMDICPTFGLRRALWEGCLMAFMVVLDQPSASILQALAIRHILGSVKNVNSLLAQMPPPPANDPDQYIAIGPFWLEMGPLGSQPVDQYILTPSVQRKLLNLARIILTRRFPILVEGPTSSGKTSAIEYLAKRTGHRFVRINNHEHTDIQEYLGTYVSDPQTGRLVFQDGLLVRALRNGDWIVLDELNLAPSDVLESLNRLLDDNRELLIPETGEVVRPHPHFMLFATQNPPGLYAGRKMLSRAFRNRFLEAHFEDVPQVELEDILKERCQIAPSYAQGIVAVFRELQTRRQTGRVFETKHGFATLRDLFRWAGRGAGSVEELARDGYMLLAERTRREDDKAVVKEVLEKQFKVLIDERTIYDLDDARVQESLGCPLPPPGRVVWTSSMKRVFVLLARALKYDEPVLLVGETGCGKTSACEVYAQAVDRHLSTVNCHQSTETSDLLGGQRPIRNRAAIQAATLRQAQELVSPLGVLTSNDKDSLATGIFRASSDAKSENKAILNQALAILQRPIPLFEWHDGALVRSLLAGDIFLLDEISLADDSVLERLNSVLEPSRSLILAEKSGWQAEKVNITATNGFQLVATMNPGGDYGKKELSPALRNRFTEIWVPMVNSREDRLTIVRSLWQHDVLASFSEPLLDFMEWIAERVGDPAAVGLRDILVCFPFCLCRQTTDQQ